MHLFFQVFEFSSNNIIQYYLIQLFKKCYVNSVRLVHYSKTGLQRSI